MQRIVRAFSQQIIVAPITYQPKKIFKTITKNDELVLSSESHKRMTSSFKREDDPFLRIQFQRLANHLSQQLSLFTSAIKESYSFCFLFNF